MVEYNPTKWSWEGTKQFVAETSYDLLDPLYGDGGALEPVTVIVDPDRTVKEEYIEPIVEDIEDIYEDTLDIAEDLEDKAVQYLKWGAAIGLLYVALK